MPDLKITGLTADTSPTSDDLIPTVTDPSGTPANRKVTLANAITKAHGLSDGFVKVATGTMGVVTPASTDISDFTEAAQDAVGAMVDSSLMYSDGTPLLQRAALTGDVTASAGGNATTIANDAVTNAKMANMATQTIKGRTTAGTGDPEDLTATQVKAILAISESDVTNLVSDLAGKQPLDSDLTTIAGLTPTTDNFIQSKSSAWASRTPAQVTADLIAFVGDSGSGGTKGLVPAPAAGDASKFLKGDGTFASIPGGGDALTTNPLSQFASTTSAQLAGVLSDETGSGAAVFGTSPTIATPTLTLKQSAAPTPTAEGAIEWDTDDNKIVIGDGAAQKVFVPTASVSGDATMDTAGAVTVASASTTASGKVEIATAAETTTGTDATRAVSPDGLAGSDYGKRVVQVALNGSTALTTSDKGYFRVPSVMSGYNLVAVAAMVQTASSSGTPTFTVKRGATNMLTTNLTIDASETDSSTAATAAVIDTSNDDVSTGQQIEVACSVAGTGTLWAVVELTFQLP